uniref:DNA (cytosine-5-)-methyltransferase n=1 Tax=Ganoderma boninense TaxID=34458 RepID=A0A5K1K4U3_9APHY|nr:Glucans biosynthesis glucosyltransferase H (EC [Ganoderma boninense]
MAPKRITAFGASFPEEAAGETISLRQDATADELSTTNLGKRKHSDNALKCNASKRLKSDAAAIHQRHAGPPVQTYHPHPDEIKEAAETVVQGEDPEDFRDGQGKPVRQLSAFVVFDPSPSRGFELIPLDLLHDSAATDRQFEAAGCVSPVYLNEEDEGQEDGVEDDEHLEPQHFRTSAIFRYMIDYEAMDDPLYVETQYAWYTVKSPAPSYKDIYRKFYTPHRIAQIVISVAQEGSVMTYSEFEDLYVGRWDHLLGDLIEWTDIVRSVPLIQSILDDIDNQALRETVLSRPFAERILNSVDNSHTPYPVRRIPKLADSSRARPNRDPLESNTMTGNLDIAVLQPKNQRPTHVTPLIDTLALGLFREHLQVIGAPPKRLSSHEIRRRQMKVHEHIGELLVRRLEGQPEIEFLGEEQLEGKYWKRVKIRGEDFKLGDCLIVDAGEYRNRPAPDIPQDLGLVPAHAVLADYFWFGKIIYIDQKEKKVHVQYYDPSSKSYLQEISNSQELFLCPQLCGTLTLSSVLGKAVVHDDYCPENGDTLDPLHYFCRFHYDETDGSFTDLNVNAGDILGPPDNCPACLLEAQRQSDSEPVVIKDGLCYLGKAYHHHDYVLISEPAAKVPASVGMIVRIRPGKSTRDGSTLMVTVRLLGRMSDLLSKESLRPTAPAGICADERELFMTEQHMDVDASFLVQRCTVIHQSRRDLQAWLARSPYHFFVQYASQTLRPKRWEELRQVKSKKIPVCKECYLADEAEAQRLETFAKEPRLSLRTFDPFAGVGAFGLAMENSGCVKVTHAVEISPSAAQTLRKNSPSTTVYNQCSNIVLRYAIKAHAKQWEGPPPDDVEGKSPLPLPPTPDQIDCIVAGFPCQPHSSLNMFQKANDRKSHLMLNLLSWVDHLRPKYCVFENVRGFLSYNLNASQAGRHRVRGGIKTGGLKFLVFALLTMGYQVRFSLLQAGQYGTPQRRVRFFLLASLKSYPLPSFPEPTHAVLHPDALHIKISDEVIKPTFITEKGTAPFKAVTIRDAIGDLLPFDWKDPGQEALDPRKGNVTVVVKYTEPYCGPSSGHYVSPPMNSYQAACRKKPATDLQHYTRVFKDSMISRIANIPLQARADYRSLKPSFAQFQFANPASATARNGFKPGMYGRLDVKDWFHTTVTNVDPTAKQSYVLHPECRRIFTIRELARSQGFPDWFVFISHRDRLKTMHRQIGNAVPWQVGEALGRELKMAMYQKWKQDRDAAIDVDAD